MKKAIVFVQEYSGRKVGDIFDVVDPINHHGTPRSDIFKEVDVDDDFDKDVMVATVTEGGAITFAVSEEKVKAKLNQKRNEKLQVLRNLRQPRLVEVDIIVNDITLQENSISIESIKKYRQALKDITEPYKNYQTDSDHADALDALSIESFDWPEKPL